MLRVLSFATCATPGLWLAWQWHAGSLGINPLDALLHRSGHWALVMLLVTLAVTPARRLSVIAAQRIRARFGKRVSDWNGLIRLRRQFGLFACFYASLHLGLYLALDAGWDIASIAADLRERVFIVVGGLAWLAMLPLAATSTQAAMRRLGGAWRRLHQLTYAIALLGLVHVAMQAKLGQSTAAPYALAAAAIAAARWWAWRQGDRDAGAEVAERGGATSSSPSPPAPRADARPEAARCRAAATGSP